MSERHPLSVAEPGADQRAAWDRFVREHPDGTFFHLSGWKPVLESAFKHKVTLLAAWRGREIHGVLPLVELRNRIFAKALVSTAFCIYGGPVARDREAGAELDAAARALAERRGVDFLEYRLRVPFDADRPCRDDLHATFRKRIDGDHDANLKAIPRKQRAVVRKAIEGDLESHVTDSLDSFYRLYATSVRNLGTPVFGRRYLDALKAEFGDACDVLLVSRDGAPVSGVLSFYFRDEVLPYYGGGTPAARRLGANDFMYWELMRHAADRGYRTFDFGRSKVGSGAYAFKKNWGFTPERLSYEYYLVKANALPDTNPSNPKYRRAIAAWRRMPLWLANCIGPAVARELG